MPPEVVKELLVDRVLPLFATVNMRLPFLPIVAATDASTVFGHGAAVANMPADSVRDIARLVCKGGAHVRLDDGPELSDELAARIGPRHDLKLGLQDFAVVLCVKFDSPGHIHLDEGSALVSCVRWILRSRKRFRRRVVVLIDSKVVIGAVSKGRSSSVPLNAIVHRLASLCFAGGPVLHCIFIPTTHSPGDQPSRGDASTWPRALRTYTRQAMKTARCPACGLLAKNHPLDQTKRLIGCGLFCRGDGIRYAYDHTRNKWVSDLDLWIQRLRRSPGTSVILRRRLDLMSDSESE